MIRIPFLDADSPPQFPPVAMARREPDGLLCGGGDLSEARLIEAYRHGIFPWFDPGEPILWWSPDPRCVFDLSTFRVARRLHRFARGSSWTLAADRDFAAVIDACAAPRADSSGTWIGREMRAAYLQLHEAGYAHSVEVRDHDQLVGGIYGVAIGRVFFGESMFSRTSGGSKIALWALARQLAEWGFPLIDAQVANPHLLSLGARLIDRTQFVGVLDQYCEKSAICGSWRELFRYTKVAELPEHNSTL